MQRRSRLALAAMALLALGLEGSANPPPPEGFVGAIRLTGPEEQFGGFSAIEMADDGMSFVALSDRGAFVQGTVERDATGAIVSVSTGPLTYLKSHEDERLRVTRSDSEGLAQAPDGSFYVSFEGATRVLRYPTVDGRAQNLPAPKVFRSYPRNASFESVAVDAQGTVYTMPEELTGGSRLHLLTGPPGNANGPAFPIWRYRDGKWTQPFDLPRRENFLPVGSDFGPDGRFYVLEREFHGLIGFTSRIRSFRVAEDGLSDEEEVLRTPIGLQDNMEGLSVWRDAAGDIRLTMITDDNFLPVLRSEIVEYRLSVPATGN